MSEGPLAPHSREQRALWRDEVPIRTLDERYVTRRQLTKFLVLTSVGMFVGNLWILLRAKLYREPVYPRQLVARVGEIPVGGVKLFRYPAEDDPCILLRLSETSYAAFSQKCTHLSCAVYYDAGKDRLECPCHEGYFEAGTGRVLQGPPTRPLPRIVLRRRGDQLLAVGVDLQED
jgi:nitrite reductase/ring-hydroxylating ferredoxin subunit